MKAFFVSDVHIGAVDSERHKAFVEFLDYVLAQKASHLIILGDLFEFLYGDAKHIVKEYKILFDKLENLYSNKVKIYYLFGNHDFNFKLPVTYIKSLPDLPDLKIDEYKIFAFHGDGLDPLDYKYRFLKRVVRSCLFKVLFNILPTSFIYKTAGIFSKISRKVCNDFVIKRKRYLYYRDYASQVLKQSELDVYILAHTHVAELIEVNTEEKTKYYVNTGFFGNARTYAKIENGSVELCKFVMKVF